MSTAPRRRKGWRKARYHVGLPAVDVNTAVNAPPEVILRLPLPGKHGNTYRKRSILGMC